MTEELGPWLWCVGGLVLFAGEVVWPGRLMLWVGIAAIATGSIALALSSGGALSPAAQGAIFIGLSAILVLGVRLI